MNLVNELFIAYRFFNSRNRSKNKYISITSIFAVLGIILGVAALIIVMAVMNGYREELVRITTGMSGHVIVKGGPVGIVNYNELVSKIKGADITEVTPFIEKQVMIIAGSETVGGIVRGIEYKDLAQKKIVTANIVSGNLSDYKHNFDTIIIGESLAINLGVKPGDEIKVVTSVTNNTVIGRIPRFKTFEVAAIFASGSYLYDSGLIFMHLGVAKQLFRMPEAVTNIEVSLKNPFLSDGYTHEIAKQINRKYYVEDWIHQNSGILTALEIEKTVMFLILTLIVLVAAMNIISSLYMLVYDKKFDIAVLRTIGFSKNSVIRIFIFMGTTVGIVGTILGLILGVSFAENIEAIRRFLEKFTTTSLFDPIVYYLNNLPSKIDYQDTAMIVITSILLSLVSTIIPALKAAKINPAEALRNE